MKKITANEMRDRLLTRINYPEKDLFMSLRAIAEGYPIETIEDRYIRIENPEYTHDNGEDPYLMIDLHKVSKFLLQPPKAPHV